MNIISKFSDFYDYEAYTYGCEPDKSIVYVRKTEIKKLQDFPSNIKKDLDNFYKKHTYHLYNICWLNGKNVPNANVQQVLIGVYPYVYCCTYVESVGYSINKLRIPIPHKLVTDYETIQEYVNEYVLKHNITERSNYFSSEVQLVNIDIGKGKLEHFWSKNSDRKKISDPDIIEDRNIFDIIGCPVFTLYENNIEYNSCINDSILLSCFDREELDMNIYSNIEQFIVNTNIKPVTEPDNKTKIVNAGFDVKTSFRNM